MVKGRNTSTITIRLPDNVVNRLKNKAKMTGQTVSDIVKPAIYDLVLISKEGLVKPGIPIKKVVEERLEIKTGDRFPGTARSAPCPCGSGKKYKRCCGVV